MNPIIIIGTGLAGIMTAKTFRQINKDTPIIFFTGDDGHFYSKPTLSNARAKHKTPDELIITPKEKLEADLNLTIHTHTPITQIDHTNQQVHTSAGIFNYQALVIATGAKAIIPKLSGDTQLLKPINSLIDYREFMQHCQPNSTISIIGAGLVGSEFANDWIDDGHTINLISDTPVPLTRITPEPIGQALLEKFKEKKVNCFMSETATDIQKNTDQSITITTDNGTTITSDHVLSAIGLIPNIALARDAGIKTNQGICVNSFCQTSIPNIYALGDCAEFDGRTFQYIAPILHASRSLAKTLHQPDQPTAVNFPVMPTIVKTPCLPITTTWNENKTQGLWKFEAPDDRMIAKLINQEMLVAYTLANPTPAEKQACLKSMQATTA